MGTWHVAKLISLSTPAILFSSGLTLLTHDRTPASSPVDALSPSPHRRRLYLPLPASLSPSQVRSLSLDIHFPLSSQTHGTTRSTYSGHRLYTRAG